MATYTDKIAFASPPRTGNTWVHRILGDVMNLELSGDGRNHDINWSDFPGHFKFTVVRHPAEWLRSWFGFWMRNCPRKFIGVPVVDDLQKCNQGPNVSFEVFLDRYLNEMPGQTRKIFEYYTEGADLTLNVETLHRDFAWMCNDHKLFTDEQVGMAMKVPPTNITTKWRREEWPHQMWYDMVVSAESEAMEKYGYNDDDQFASLIQTSSKVEVANGSNN